MFIVKAVKRLIKFCIAAAILLFVLYCGICIAFPMDYYDIIEKYSQEYHIEPSLVCAVINAESGFNPDAQSNKGARGLMQIMESTALWAADKIPIEDFTIFQLNDPETNINLGCWYLSYLLNEYDGDLTLSIASYNAGSGNVNSWLYDEKYSDDGKTLASIPFDETDNYVKKINVYKLVYDILIKVRFYEII